MTTNNNKLGWLVVESTTREGCDISPSIQQFWLRCDAIAEAKSLRLSHASDECYRVIVRRETSVDADKYGNYVAAG